MSDLTLEEIENELNGMSKELEDIMIDSNAKPLVVSTEASSKEEDTDIDNNLNMKVLSSLSMAKSVEQLPQLSTQSVGNLWANISDDGAKEEITKDEEVQNEEAGKVNSWYSAAAGIGFSLASTWTTTQASIAKVTEKAREVAESGLAQKKKAEFDKLFVDFTQADGTVTTVVTAGTITKIPFFVPKNNAVAWKIMIKNFDVGFGVLLRVQEMGGAVEKDLEPQTTIQSGDVVVGGRKAASDIERYLLLAFDNSYSKLRSKEVAYQLVKGDAAVRMLAEEAARVQAEEEAAAVAAAAAAAALQAQAEAQAVALAARVEAEGDSLKGARGYVTPASSPEAATSATPAGTADANQPNVGQTQVETLGIVPGVERSPIRKYLTPKLKPTSPPSTLALDSMDDIDFGSNHGNDEDEDEDADVDGASGDRGSLGVWMWPIQARSRSMDAEDTAAGATGLPVVTSASDDVDDPPALAPVPAPAPAPSGGGGWGGMFSSLLVTAHTATLATTAKLKAATEGTALEGRVNSVLGFFDQKAPESADDIQKPPEDAEAEVDVGDGDHINNKGITAVDEPHSATPATPSALPPSPPKRQMPASMLENPEVLQQHDSGVQAQAWGSQDGKVGSEGEGGGSGAVDDLGQQGGDAQPSDNSDPHVAATDAATTTATDVASAADTHTEARALSAPSSPTSATSTISAPSTSLAAPAAPDIDDSAVLDAAQIEVHSRGDEALGGDDALEQMQSRDTQVRGQAEAEVVARDETGEVVARDETGEAEADGDAVVESGYPMAAQHYLHHKNEEVVAAAVAATHEPEVSEDASNEVDLVSESAVAVRVSDASETGTDQVVEGEFTRESHVDVQGQGQGQGQNQGMVHEQEQEYDQEQESGDIDLRLGNELLPLGAIRAAASEAEAGGREGDADDEEDEEDLIAAEAAALVAEEHAAAAVAEVGRDIGGAKGTGVEAED